MWIATFSQVSRSVFITGLAVFLQLTASWARGATLEQMDAYYDDQIRKLELAYREQMKNLERGYVRALDRGVASAQEKSNLNAVLALQQEISRLEQGGKLRTDLPEGAPAALKTMQSKIAEAQGNYQRVRSQEIEKLTLRYISNLDSRSAAATRNGNIDQALRYRDRANQLREHPKYLAALDVLAKSQNLVSAGGSSGNSTTAAEVPSEWELLNRKAPALVSIPATRLPAKTTAYVKGCEMDINTKRVRSSTPSAAGSGMTRVSCNVALVDDKDTRNSWRTSYSSSRTNYHTVVPRLTMTPLPNKPLGKSLVVFDYYSRGKGSLRNRIATHSVLVPPLEAGESIVVDSQPHRYSVYKYRSAYSGTYKSTTGDEFYGFVVSVFGTDGDLILQRSSNNALHDIARTQPPQPNELTNHMP